MHKSFHENIGGVLLGLFVSSLISFFIWLYAYYGYTDLGLPQRADFERIDNVIRKYIPNDYEYSIGTVDFRGSHAESLVITARAKNAFNLDAVVNSQSDILLILDKVKDAYRMSYRFQPNDILPALHITTTSPSDLNNDGRDEIFTTWSFMGANFSNPYAIVFSSTDNGEVKALSAPRLSNYRYPEGYRFTKIVNHFNSNEYIEAETAYRFYASEHTLLAVNRSDDACNACGEEHIYNLNILNMYDSRLNEIDTPVTGINGYASLVKYARENGYIR